MSITKEAICKFFNLPVDALKQSYKDEYTYVPTTELPEFTITYKGLPETAIKALGIEKRNGKV